jgi:predicted alpha/beta superfamily hydrolase
LQLFFEFDYCEAENCEALQILRSSLNISYFYVKTIDMKYTILLLLTFILHSASAQQIARVEHVKIVSDYLNQEREILIYTPSDYDWRTNEYFNVLYVFDCQNREFFDYTTSIVSFLSDASKSFIVVGISSPYIEEDDYARNNDLLPVLNTEDSQKRFGKYSGNAENFLRYVSSEVIPYVRENYRILDNPTAIGHSLSASFILYSMMETSNLFQNYIAISPNFAYDEHRLSRELMEFNYERISRPTFVYLSHADEGIDYWPEWKPAREKTYDFFRDSLDDQNLTVEIQEFPDYSHWSTFPPSLNAALQYYFEHLHDEQLKILSEPTFEVTIRVKVPEKDDELFIAGNQDKLGNWNPSKVKMDVVSDFERSITVRLQSPTQFKFTRGSWESEAEVSGTYSNIMIRPELKDTFEFEIESYSDRF